MSPVSRLLVLSLVLACGGSELPEPKILSVQPAQVAFDEAAHLVLRVEAVAPFNVDYADRTLTGELRATLWVGAREIGPLEAAPGGLLVAQLPAGLPQGAQDVRLTLADGRSAVATGALEVTPSRAEVGFLIDDIGDQERGVPFPVTVRAQGLGSGSFDGVVLLFDSLGAPLSPPTAGPFDRGVITVQVTVDRNAPSVVLGVRDSLGRVGFSNAFRVSQHN